MHVPQARGLAFCLANLKFSYIGALGSEWARGTVPVELKWGDWAIRS